MTTPPPHANQQGYVFKLHHNDDKGTIQSSRRYGFTGELNTPAVFKGLHDRASQIFSLSPKSYQMGFRRLSASGKLVILKDYETFVKEVYEPLADQSAGGGGGGGAKDAKGRVVLHFEVRDLIRPQSVTKTTKIRKSGNVVIGGPCASPTALVGKGAVKSGESEKTKGEAAGDETLQMVETVNALARGKDESAVGYRAYGMVNPFLPISAAAAGPAVDPAAPTTTSASTAPAATDLVTSVKSLLTTFISTLNTHLDSSLGEQNALSLRLNFQPSALSFTPTAVPIFADGAVGAVEKAAHAGVGNGEQVFCDHCLNKIPREEKRFKCLVCPNYDLDMACYSIHLAGQAGGEEFAGIIHEAGHGFMAQGGVEMVSHVRVEEKEKEKVKVEVVHDATCDLCDKRIHGVRHKCMNCPDFDVCSTCYLSTSLLHPTHNFIPLTTSTRFPVLPSSLPIHHGVNCDSCQHRIQGIRYKCLDEQCPDFDLCEKCEALPAGLGIHDPRHHLLKIKVPVMDPLGRRKLGEEVVKGREYVEVEKKVVEEVKGGEAHAHDARFGFDMFSSPSYSVDSPQVVADGVESAQAGNDAVERVSESAPSPPLISEAAVVERVEKNGDMIAIAGVVAEEEERTVPTFAATFVEDVTLHDGSILPGGAEFHKIWKVKNTGSAPWPSSSHLVLIDGLVQPADSEQQEREGKKEFKVESAAPGESVEVIVELKAPETAGRYLNYWRLAGNLIPGDDTSTTVFGDRLWLDITVESEETSDHPTSSTHSLSSSFVAPKISNECRTGTESTETTPEGSIIDIAEEDDAEGGDLTRSFYQTVSPPQSIASTNLTMRSASSAAAAESDEDGFDLIHQDEVDI